MTELTAWFDIAQKIGSGAAFVLGIGLIFLWRAYLQELTYSKQRDAQTLTVLLNLTNLMETNIERDKETAARAETNMTALLNAVAELRELVRSHYGARRKEP